ncbi:MAG: hypothetical protein HKN34_01960, partial [Gammaproteobacteria bacterium]|nr:hypothetical protein [Gammaproteobacteria bacterium]
MSSKISLISRSLAYVMVVGVFLYLVNNYLVFWQEMPGLYNLFSHYGYFGFEELNTPLEAAQITQGWIQFSAYTGILLLGILYVFISRNRSMQDDSIRFAILAAYIIRFSFWWVFLVGFADMLISFLRVEDFLSALVGEELTNKLGRPIYRGTYVHYPLIIISLFVAARFKTVSFSWLALMVVLSEFLIV